MNSLLNLYDKQIYKKYSFLFAYLTTSWLALEGTALLSEQYLWPSYVFDLILGLISVGFMIILIHIIYYVYTSRRNQEQNELNLLLIDEKVVRNMITTHLHELPMAANKYNIDGASSVTEATALMQSKKYDLVIIDMAMALEHQSLFFDQIQGLCGCKVMILGMIMDSYSIMKMLKNGVVGFVKKESFTSELRLALEVTLNNGVYYSGVIAQTLARRLNIALPERNVLPVTYELHSC